MPFPNIFKGCIDYFSPTNKEDETDVTKLRIKIPIQYGYCRSCGKKHNIETFEYCSCLNSNGKKAYGRYRPNY